MVNVLRYLNLILVLPDNRLLLKRDKGTLSRTWQWSVTEEQYLGTAQDGAVEANKILLNNYKLSPSLNLVNGSVDLERIAPVQSLTGKFVLPFVAKVNHHISFQAKMAEQFRAVRFDDLLDEIMANSIYPKAGDFPLHTPVAIHTARACHERRIFE